MLNIHLFCKSFYHSHFIPVFYYNNQEECQYAFPSQLKRLEKIFSLFKKEKDLEIHYASHFSVLYKMNLKHQQGFLILGPFCINTPTSDELSEFLTNTSVPSQEREVLESYIQQIPIISINQSLYIVDQVNTAVNREQIDIINYFGLTHHSREGIQENLTNQLHDAKEYEKSHNTYFFEKRLNQAIKSGNQSKVHELLVNQEQVYYAGQLSDNRLRQLKNIFIAAITLAVRAAVEGGLAIERAYQLSDIYINECEHLADEASIYSLSYTMYLDFTRRVADTKPANNYSHSVQLALDYIQTHTNTALNVQDISNHVGFSYSFFSKQFKSETGQTLNKAILEAKIEEAKELLVYTNKSISHISNYLCFSSQSYFQNQFKKCTGQTPLNFRKYTKK